MDRKICSQCLRSICINTICEYRNICNFNDCIYALLVPHSSILISSFYQSICFSLIDFLILLSLYDSFLDSQVADQAMIIVVRFPKIQVPQQKHSLRSKFKCHHLGHELNLIWIHHHDNESWSEPLSRKNPTQDLRKILRSSKKPITRMEVVRHSQHKQAILLDRSKVQNQAI
mgnify:CR=1 FL=1